MSKNWPLWGRRSDFHHCFYQIQYAHIIDLHIQIGCSHLCCLRWEISSLLNLEKKRKWPMLTFRSLKSLQVAPLEGLFFWGGSLCHRQEFLLGFGVARGSTVSPSFCHVSCLSVFLVLFGAFFFFFAIYSLLHCYSAYSWLRVPVHPPSKPALRRSVTYKRCDPISEASYFFIFFIDF